MRVYKESLTTKYLYVFVLLTVVFGFATVYSETTLNDSNQQKLSKIIIVDKSGKSDFSTIQSAIDSIPENNNQWIHTLWDVSGLHYFKSCFIEGAVDFIFGGGQSIYEDCDISVISEGLSVMKKDDAEEFVVVGFITAQGRDIPEDPSAFVFKECRVFGTDKVYLGRAWISHSIVLFYKSKLSDVVIPKGWDSWNYVGQEGKITYAEHECFGQGSDKSQRFDWIKTLSQAMVYKLTSITFIDKEDWIKEQP
ncbi:probable pectinesterase 29 [Papaver somniferum]|uniref:probable pectinesterase 29 n=1 Tax=Papaver somniferum TaxID=3469 RepID=UPI000E6F5C1C|nr:probable pectinesterase 29 [Papaver somniferum]